MNETLFIGFKGKNNAPSALVKSISANSILITNSFAGIKRDIESLKDTYDCITLFGIDKTLRNTVRIESTAKRETKEVSALNLENISSLLDEIGIFHYISHEPTAYLCNDAYWHLLQKFNGNAVLIHIPSAKHLSESLMERLIQFCMIIRSKINVL